MTLNSVLLDANTQVEAVTDQNGNPANQPPPAGYQYALVNLSMTNSQPFPVSDAGYFEGGPLAPAGVYVVEDAQGGFPESGGLTSQIDPICAAPAPDLDSIQLPADQTVAGNLCFAISTQAPSTSTTMFVALNGDGPPLWFALH